uniref:Zgc:162297 n=1 Tax=Fundulus heteroclitus TaxID=8078 RepID=A0A3Q2ULT1_FUNHE
MKFQNLFGSLKSVVIGMIHVKALPGTPLGCLTMSQIIKEACHEAEVYLDAGIDALIIENMHDVPYSFNVGPEVCACMTAICSAVRGVCPTLPLGVQILSSANQQALAVALASGLDFIRAEGFVFSHVADEGLLNAGAGDLLRYRKQIGADDVQIFTDIKKKHSSHALTSDVTIKDTARAAEYFLSDGVVITGAATGDQADPRELREVSQSVKIPVLVGSGVTHDNVESFLDASGMIIGSHFKHGGHWANAIDPEKVKRFMAKIHHLRMHQR